MRPWHLTLVLATAAGAALALSPDWPDAPPPPQVEAVVEAPVAPRAPQPPLPPPEARSAVPFESGDTWHGWYFCRQGLTELDLVIERVDPDRTVVARFEFEHAPTDAAGSFRVAGAYDPARETLQLDPQLWLDRPEGYESVGLTGAIRGSVFAGAIRHEGCGAFAVRRNGELELHDAGEPVFVRVGIERLRRGIIHRSAVDEILRGATPGVEACYIDALVQRPWLRGRVTTLVEIDEAGRVESATTGAHLVEAPAVGDCIARRLAELRFPEPVGGDRVVLEVGTGLSL